MNTPNKNNRKILCVGAGFSGAVIARKFAEDGYTVQVIDERDHVAGNCHTYVDAESGIMVHKYGPHIFHTAQKHVWEYVTGFAKFMPYVNRVKAVVQGNVYSLPINLHTINQFFGKNLSPKAAADYVKSKTVSNSTPPQSFEDQALAFVGPELYRAFFYGYTCKQWGVEPSQLPASILKRLPLRFNYDDNYFNHPYQGIPEHGYTALVEKILDHDNIELCLNTKFEEAGTDFQHIFYSGPIDRYFDFELGRLGYRTLKFEMERSDQDTLGTAVMNYCDQDVPWTRISDHKYFAPWTLDKVKGSLTFREFSSACGPEDTPYYPIHLNDDRQLLETYVARAKEVSNVTFVGRLGTYRYLDMDVTIAEALHVAEESLAALAKGEKPENLYVEIA